MSKKKTVTIVRSKWARGNDIPVMPDQDYSNSLRNSDGSQCCMGFVCRAIGYKVAEIAGVTLPSKLGDAPDWLVSRQEAAMDINDDTDTHHTSRQREKELKALFAGTPVTLKFVP